MKTFHFIYTTAYKTGVVEEVYEVKAENYGGANYAMVHGDAELLTNHDHEHKDMLFMDLIAGREAL
jgi:hypothetical protein